MKLHSFLSSVLVILFWINGRGNCLSPENEVRDSVGRRHWFCYKFKLSLYFVRRTLKNPNSSRSTSNVYKNIRFPLGYSLDLPITNHSTPLKTTASIFCLKRHILSQLLYRPKFNMFKLQLDVALRLGFNLYQFPVDIPTLDYHSVRMTQLLLIFNI